MKKLIIYILPVFVFAVLITSCDLTELNENVKDPAEVPPANLFANSQVSMGTFLHQVNVNVGIFQFMAQHWTMTLYTSETRYDIEGRTIAANDWDIMYDALNDLQQASQLIKANDNPAISDAEKANKQALIEVMETLIYSKLVDIFGNVPYTEALNPQNQPAYDEARTIYAGIIDSLNTAISNMTVGAPNFGSTDIIYNGNIAKWKKFANSLKLRLGMMLADVDNAAAKAIVESAVAGGVFTSNADNAMIPFQTVQPFANPVWENVIASGRQDYVPARPLVSRMNELNDPRRSLFFTKHQGKYKGGIYGETNSYGDFSHFSETVVLPGRDALYMGYAEVEFLLAEARARGYDVGGTAESHYKKAIRADMEFWNARAAAAGVNDEITDQEIAAYLAQPKVQWDSSNWREVLGLQKWIGLFDQYLQAYTAYRRLDSPTLEPPEQAVQGLEIVPRRYHYPVSEQRYNPGNYDDAAQAIGGDTFVNRLFWDVRGPGQ